MPKLRQTVICGLPIHAEIESVIIEESKEDEDSPNRESKRSEQQSQMSFSKPSDVEKGNADDEEEINLRGEIWKISCHIDDLKEEMLTQFQEDKGRPNQKHFNSVVDRIDLNGDNNNNDDIKHIPPVFGTSYTAEQIDSDPFELTNS